MYYLPILHLLTRISDSKKSKKSKATVKKAPAPKAVPTPYVNPYIKPAPAGDEDDFMASLLGGLDDNAKIQPTTSFVPKPSAYAIGRKRKLEEEAAFKEAERARTGFRTTSKAETSGPLVGGSNSNLSEGLEDSNGKRAKVESIQIEDFTLEDVEMGDETLDDIARNGNDSKSEPAEDEDDMFVKPAIPSTSKAKSGPPIRRQLVNSSNKPAFVIPKPEPVDDDAVAVPAPPPILIGRPASKPKGMDWKTATTGLALAVAPESEESLAKSDEIDSTEADAFKAPFAPKAKKGKAVVLPPRVHANAFEEDGSLRFWWYDMVDLNGVVYLVGKVQEKDGKKGWVSGMLIVTGIARKLYILPREKMLDGS